MGKDLPKYDLEDRTFKFALRVRSWIRKLPRTLTNKEDARQLVRASGSIGANYIEANEGLGAKDFVMHVKISRKEAKESRFFYLRLMDTRGVKALDAEREALVQEALELTLIFNAIVKKRQ